MFEEITELTGKENGPTSIILTGVHGDERCGVEAMKKLLPTLQILRGRVLVAYGNPRAIEQNVRFTERNLNRMFKSDSLLSDTDKKSYEYQRAQFLKKYLDQADALLDVHASFTPKSRRFAICESNARELIRSLPFDLVVSGFDEVEPGGTDGYMNSKGKIGICAECGFLGDPASTEIAEQCILTFLRLRGHIAGDTKMIPQSYINIYNLYLTKTDAFVLTKPFIDFEEVSSGQLIGMDGKKEVRSPKDSVILFARNRNEKGDEAFLLGEYRKNLA